MTDLLPCPLCGGDAELWRAHPEHKRTAWIACMAKCSVLVSKEYPTDEDAIAAWNTRPAEDALRARVAELEAEWRTLAKGFGAREDRWDRGHASALRVCADAIATLKGDKGE